MIYVCSCNAVKVGNTWIHCPCAIQQLQEQEVEFEIETCPSCEIEEIFEKEVDVLQ